MAKTEKGKTGETCMYIGPTLLGETHVQHGALFIGGKLLPHLAGAVKKNAQFARLFVPLSELGQAQQELRNKDSELARAAYAVHRGA